MRIQKLTLCNIGTFRGKHTFDLSTSPDKPVVLIGGRNGAGKTTVLEAIQWSLFGKLIKTPRREKANRGSYSIYLENLIHRGSTEEESYAQIELLLQQPQGDVEVVLKRKINRGSKCTEELAVMVNEEYLPLPFEQWPNMIDAILPSTLSQLYLFDGEQIESLADPETSSEFLKTGIHALLGVDLIDQLSADLVTLKRKEIAAAPEESVNLKEEKQKIDNFEKDIIDASQGRAKLVDELADLRSNLDTAEKEASKAETKFKKSGAELYENHLERQTEIRILESNQITIENELRDYANGLLPILYLQNIVGNYVTLGIQQRSAANERSAINGLVSGITELEKWLVSNKCSKKTLLLVEEFKKVKTDQTVLLEELPESNVVALELAESLVSSDGFESEILAVKSCFNKLELIEAQVSKLEKANELALSKEEAETARVFYEESIKKLVKAQSSLSAKQEELDKSILVCEFTTKQYDQYLQSKQLDQHDGSKVVRFSDACEKAKDYLTAFRQAVVSKNIDRIESRIWKRFNQLLRKNQLGSGVKIDSTNYTLSLIDADGIILPAERLSAGERQLLATAMLWGLADSSSMQLPVIIDTPLGRLDRNHRSNLVSEYFQNASSQVVLLSTDEEIDERWLPILDPSIARMYLIDFDDEQQCSSVKEGYFEMEMSHV
jgi:DNA sulfur modification protein DndD